jgi:hypothetical protein
VPAEAGPLDPGGCAVPAEAGIGGPAGRWARAAEAVRVIGTGGLGLPKQASRDRPLS